MIRAKLYFISFAMSYIVFAIINCKFKVSCLVSSAADLYVARRALSSKKLTTHLHAVKTIKYLINYTQ